LLERRLLENLGFLVGIDDPGLDELVERLARVLG
jgi:hypothetical protein